MDKGDFFAFLQTVPISIQPFLRRFAIQTMRAQHGLETHCMFHNDRVAQFMNDNIVNDKFRGFNQSPIDRDVFFRGTIAPLPFLTADIQFVVWQKQRLGKLFHSS